MLLLRRESFPMVAVVVAAVAVALPLTVSARLERVPPSAEKRVTLTVEGMTCGGCAAAVKMAAEKVEGVKSAKVSHEKGTVDVTYDPEKTTPEAIAKAITENTGFKATAPKQDARR